MSLNRYEQAVFTYLQAHPEELRHWENKVATRAARGGLSVATLAEELSDYIRERETMWTPFASGWRREACRAPACLI
jgi:predicted ATPase